MLKTNTVGWWWRFSAYETIDECIRPAAGAVLERYDPWKDYLAATEGDRPGTAGKRSLRTPYSELFELLERSRTPGELFQPSDQLKDDIAAWCSKHGLLGLLVHRTRTLRLAARWQIDNPHSPDPGRQLVPKAREFIRRSDGWERRETILDGGAYHLLDEHPEMRDQLVRSEDLRTGDSEGNAELLEHLGSFNYRREPLAQSWGRYFPRVPPELVPTYQFPHPLNDEFWHEYAEPIDDFLRAAAMLLDTARGLALVKERELTATETLRWQSAQYKLAALVDAVRSFPWISDPPDGRVRELRTCPSLLASFAKMCLEDLDIGRVFTCAECGSLAVSSAWQAGYCSTRCRNAAAKRRYRASLKLKKGKRNGKTKGKRRR